MEYRTLGTSDLRVSVLGFGGMTFGGVGRYEGIGQVDAQGASRLLSQAFDAGVNLIDTADTYSYGVAEEILGKALGGKRDEFIIATKGGQRAVQDGPHPGSGRRYIIEACEASLRRLGTDYIDLYQLHVWDGLTPIEETLEALGKLVRDGKVRHVGCSNFSAWHLARCLSVADAADLPRFVSHQFHYSLLSREVEYEIMPLGLNQDVGGMVWSPLAGGVLAAVRSPHEPPSEDSRLAKFGDVIPLDVDRAGQVVECLRRHAGELGVSPAAVAISWLIGRPGVSTAILGARTEAQLQANLDATRIKLPDEATSELDEVSAPPLIYPYFHQRRFARLGPEDAVMLLGAKDGLRRREDEAQSHHANA